MSDDALARLYPMVGQLRTSHIAGSFSPSRAGSRPSHHRADNLWSAQPVLVPVTPHYAQTGADLPTQYSVAGQIGWVLLFGLAALLALAVAAASGLAVVLFELAASRGAPWAPYALTLGAIAGIYSLCVALAALTSAFTRPYDGVGGLELAVVFSPLAVGLAAMVLLGML